MRRRLLLAALLAAVLLASFAPLAHSHGRLEEEEAIVVVDDAAAIEPVTPSPSAAAGTDTVMPKKRKLQSDFQPPAQPAPSSNDTAADSDWPKKVVRYGLLPNPDPWTFEITAITVLVLYLANLLYHARANSGLAVRVFQSLLPSLRQQFSLVGAYGESVQQSAALKTLTSDSDTKVQYYQSSLNEFQLSLTGRRGVDQLLLTMETIKRHDLFSLVLSKFDLVQKTDFLTIDAQFAAMPSPIILAIVRKKYEKRMRKNVRDLEWFTQTTKTSRVPLPPSLAAMTDCVDGFESVLADSALARLMGEHSEWFVLLHVSDQALPLNDSANTRVLHCKLELPSPMTDARLTVLTSVVMAVLDLIDRVSALRLSQSSLTKSLALRQRAAEVEQKRLRDEQEKENPKPVARKEKAKDKKPKMKMMRG